MRFRLRKRLIVAAIVSAAIIPAMLIGASSALADGGSGTTINAKAGAGESGYSVNAFLPQKLTVQTGTTVNWSFTWPEPHMIVLDNGLTPADLSGPEPPADSSPFDFDGVRKYVYSGEFFGQQVNGPTFAIKFEKAGNYNIECLIHPGMTGTVTVVDSGTADTQATADARSQSEYATAITAMKTAADAKTAQPTKVTAQADGSKLYQVDMLDQVAGVGGTFNYIQQFFPAAVNITAGDSVEWSNPTLNTVHTVTFNVDNSGLDPNTTDPFEVPPAVPANNVYDGGTEFVHSGILGGSSGDGPDDPNSAPNPTTFTLKFSKAGSYSYICLLHGDQGMTGTVNVAAQTTPPPTATPSPTATPAKTATGTVPLPPNTGSGTNSGGTSASLWMALGVLAALFAVSGGSVIAVKRHS